LSHQHTCWDQKSTPKKTLLCAGLVTLLALSSCQARSLDPAGPAASAIANLWWAMFITSSIVFIVVMVALVLALRKREVGDRGHNLSRNLVTYGGVIVPGIIVFALMIYNTYITVQIEEPPNPPVTTIQATAFQFWWDFDYVEYGFRTANEIHIPAGEAVLVQLHSDDVIHAFWVPQLHGKRDMMPDHVGQIWLQADEPGTYRGVCAEFCGMQHAKMQFLVIAHEPEDYEAWVEQHRAIPPVPEDPRVFQGQQIFLGSECVYCHTVRGTNASGTLGPDLTNLASRRELGAGTLPNTRGHLAGWIIDPQQFKPGNLMPPSPLDGQDLLDMLVYLESLR
jgi:cytochrome c oxidase subunit II